MKKVVLALGLFTLCNLSFGQQKIDFNLENSCNYYGEKVEGDIYGFASTQEAEQIVKKILDVVGLEPRFTIMAANVSNAMAVIENQMRHILYSQDFIMRINNATGTDWASLSILAHEIAHHLQGHTIMSSGSRPNLELEADQWSGFVCAKLGATLDQAQAAMRSMVSNTGSSTHPPTSARLEAIAIGWYNGNGSFIPDPPLTPVNPTNNNNTQSPPPPTLTNITIVYPGDPYYCSLPIRVTIDNQIFIPTGNTLTISNIPLGKHTYSIVGNINCPMIGGCVASGTGEIDVTPNSTFNLFWQNTAYSQCRIWLQAK